MKQNFALDLTESGYLPDSLVRHGIRQLLKDRLLEVNALDISRIADEQSDFIRQMDNADIALLPQLANDQHYEVPQEFYKYVLGPNGKYSSCYWPTDVNDLASAEQAALQQTCERAGIVDGMISWNSAAAGVH